MLVLDTDHISEIDRQTSLGLQLLQRLETSGRQFGTTIVNVEEVLRGLMSHIGRQRDEARRIEWYRRLLIAVQSRSKRRTLLWDDAAVSEFRKLNSQGIRIGTMDLRIASITIANGATLLTRNLKDFTRVHGLRVENWLE